MGVLVGAVRISTPRPERPGGYPCRFAGGRIIRRDCPARRQAAFGQRLSVDQLRAYGARTARHAAVSGAQSKRLPESDAASLCANSPFRRAHGRDRFLRFAGSPRQSLVALPNAEPRPDRSSRSRSVNWRKCPAPHGRTSTAACANGSGAASWNAEVDGPSSSSRRLFTPSRSPSSYRCKSWQSSQHGLSMSFCRRGRTAIMRAGGMRRTG